MSIRSRLTLWYSAILAVTLVVFGIVVYVSLSYLLYDNQKQQAIRVSQELELQMKRASFIFRGQPYMRLPEMNEFRYNGFFLQIVDSTGQVQSSNLRSGVSLPVPDKLKTGGDPGDAFFENTTIEPYPFVFLVYNKPIYFGEGGSEQFVGVLQVAATVDDIVNALQALRVTLVLIAFATVVLAASIGWFLSRKALRPIELVIDAADHIQRDVDLDKRIEYKGPHDEIGRLTATINGMLSRIQTVYTDLEQAYRAQRRFVSDASHELRTPLTTIRGNVELLEKMWRKVQAEGRAEDEERVALTLEAMHDISSEAERMSRLVSDLLALARADAGYEMRKDRVELRPLLEDVIRRAGFLPRTAEWVTGDLSPLDGVFVTGDKDYLQQLVFIFVENAFKYTKEGHVMLDSLVRDGRAGIRVSDTGMGMDKEDVPHIFDRFYRADLSRGETAGTGLGLSIAKWIIDEHRGAVEVVTQKGKGTTFMIWLPLHFQEVGE
ncbi:sensor histidine kinase [Paenibacillus turpanensis]|uniref:sensor histidine kinase n=1 Tax=Paenibacillus turpanensis TaxID=2689078 RepID=UPI00140AEBED|nr:HAMP domain-containing sensor histidine kinase [Paenibacillus turpanensis]